MSKPKNQAATTANTDPAVDRAQIDEQQRLAAEATLKAEAEAKELADAQAAEQLRLQKEADDKAKADKEEAARLEQQAKEEEEAQLAAMDKETKAILETLPVDDRSNTVRAVEEAVLKFVKVNTTPMTPALRADHHTAFIRLVERVIALPNPNEFTGSMDVIFRAYRNNREATQTFHPARVHAFASQVKVNNAGVVAYQFFINALSTVADHLNEESSVDFNLFINPDLFEEHYPGLPGERLLNYFKRLCK